MSSAAYREATPADVAFLARAMQEADRGHTGVGSWDLVLPGDESGRLATLARLAEAGSRSHVHWSQFLIADVDGRPAAAAAGYVPAETPGSLLLEAAAEAQIDDAVRANLVAEGRS